MAIDKQPYQAPAATGMVYFRYYKGKLQHLNAKLLMLKELFR